LGSFTQSLGEPTWKMGWKFEDICADRPRSVMVISQRGRAAQREACVHTQGLPSSSTQRNGWRCIRTWPCRLVAPSAGRPLGHVTVAGQGKIGGIAWEPCIVSRVTSLWHHQVRARQLLAPHHKFQLQQHAPCMNKPCVLGGTWHQCFCVSALLVGFADKPEKQDQLGASKDARFLGFDTWQRC
jgi:hypothetical protein